MGLRNRNKTPSVQPANDTSPTNKATSNRSQWIPTNWLVCALLIAVCLGVYYNSLWGDFCYDDHYAIKNNPDCTGQSSFWDLWKHDFWGQDIHREDSHKSYRPLTVLSFRFDYWLHNSFFNITSSGRNAEEVARLGYNSYRRLLLELHLGNLLLHTVVTIQVYFLGKIVFKDITRSVVAALLFAAHPIHTEAVSGLVGRAELLSSALGLCGVLVYIYASKKERQLPFVLFSGTMVWLAILCKETAFTFFGVMLVWEILQQSTLLQLIRAKIFPSRFQIYTKHENFFTRGFWKRTIIILAHALLYLAVRKSITVHFTVMNYRRVENPVAFQDYPYRWLSNALLHARYAWLLLFPYPLSADYSYDCLPLVTSFTDYRNIFSILLYGALLFAVLVNFSKLESGGKERLFWLTLLIFPFIPASNIFFYVGTMLAERLLYLPSVGFCYIMSDSIISLLTAINRNQQRSTKIAFIFIVTLLLAYGYLTIERNRDWDNEERLFYRAEEVCPNSAKVQYNLGIIELGHKNFAKAKLHFDRTLQIEPNYCEVDLQYGILAWEHNQNPNLAVQHFKNALKCKYTLVKAAESLHKIYSALLELFPDNYFYVEQWADILTELSRDENAYDHYLQAGIGFEKSGMKEHAMRCFNKALKAKTTEHTPYLWLAQIYEKQGDLVHAFKALYAASGPHSRVKVFALNALMSLYPKLDEESKAKLKSSWEVVVRRAQELTQQDLMEAKRFAV